MPEHTPGPWEYGTMKEWAKVGKSARLVAGRGWFIGPARRGLDIAEVHLTASQDAEQQEANARLMAAAPDLLAALKALVNFQRGRENWPEVQAAEAAIAKAEGG